MQTAKKQDHGILRHTYVVLIRKEPQTDYWAEIPDIPGCASSGESAEAALAHFEEALCLYIKEMLDDGAHLPPPRGIEEVISSDSGSFAEIYTVDVADPQLLLTLRFSRLARPPG